MPFWQRIEVRLSLLMVLVTSLATVALTTYQRVQLFRELPPELRELFRRNEAISIPPELREMALQGRALWVQVQPSGSPDNPNPIYLMRPANPLGVAPGTRPRPGLPSEALERVFDRFYRVENSRSRAMEGSGLGLSIVKTLVELHGGEVRASNHPEGGALFEVRLPLSLKEEA